MPEPIVLTAIAKKIIESGLKATASRLERNRHVLPLLKLAGLGALKNDFESIYAHALVEYGIDKKPELVTLFALDAVKGAFQSELLKKDEAHFERILDDALHTAPEANALKSDYPNMQALKDEIEQFRNLFDYFTMQSATPFQLKKYNEDNEFKLQMLEEKERRSFDYQARKHLETLAADFRDNYLVGNKYVPLRGEHADKKSELTRQIYDPIDDCITR